jgi:16S rRNA processing protein RimM
MELGAVGAPYGVRGWFKCRSDTSPPDRLVEHKSWWLGVRGEWREYELEANGHSAGQITAKLRGVDSPEQAATLRGAVIALPRQLLPPPAPREFYRADLLGFEVRDMAGTVLGKLQYFVETPAHALMAVSGSREYLIPAMPPHLRRVDLVERRVVVEWQEPAD